MGAKTRYDNLTLFEADKAGNPLGYVLPLGQLVYFLARDDTAEGTVFSIHYYHAEELKWIPNSGAPGTYIPVTSPIVFTKDAVVPAGSYALFYLSQRVGTAVPNTHAPKVFYKYLVVHIQRVAPSVAPLPTGVMMPAGN